PRLVELLVPRAHKQLDDGRPRLHANRAEQRRDVIAANVGADGLSGRSPLGAVPGVEQPRFIVVFMRVLAVGILAEVADRIGNEPAILDVPCHPAEHAIKTLRAELQPLREPTLDAVDEVATLVALQKEPLDLRSVFDRWRRAP